jgi:P-type Ca2+ transporter type 2C
MIRDGNAAWPPSAPSAGPGRGLALAAGSRVRPWYAGRPALPAAIAMALALQVAGLYVPFLRDLLHTQPLSAADLLVVCALSCLGYAAVRLDRVVHRDKTAAAARHRLAKA